MNHHQNPMPVVGKILLLIFLLSGLLLAVLSGIGWRDILHNGDGSLSASDWHVVDLLGFAAAAFLIAFPAWVWLGGRNQLSIEDRSSEGTSAGGDTSTTATPKAPAPGARYVQIGRNCSFIAALIAVIGLASLKRAGMLDFFAAGALISALGLGVGRFFGKLVETSLHDAAIQNQSRAVESLLARGADVTARDAGGATPLHYAAGKGHTRVAELLLAHNAEVDARTNQGGTPLHWAASHGHKDVAALLLANKADVNAKDNNGYTSLHYSTAKGHKDLTELLRSRGGQE